MQSVIVKAVVFSICYNEFFAKSTHIYCENALQNINRTNSFTDNLLLTSCFENHPPSHQLGLIQNFETTGGVLNARYHRACSVLTRAFSNLVHHIDCCLIGEEDHFQYVM